MQVTEDLVRSVVAQVLARMRGGQPAPGGNGHAAHGVFQDVGDAVSAAHVAQREF